MFKGQSIRIFAASLFASTLVGSAIADIVYDDVSGMSAAPTSTVEVRSVINTTEAVSTPPVIVETQKIQKYSEKSREKRGFQESVNNELVIQKLEDRRLKQEEKLTNEINKKFTLEDEPAGTAAPVAKQEEAVKPIAEANPSYEMSAAPKAEAAVSKPIVQEDQIINYQSSTNMSVAPVGKTEGENSFKNGVSIIPKAGISTISNSAYNITPKFMTGVGLGLDVSDHVAVEFGYAYSENGVRLDSVYGGFQPRNELLFKNNTFDLGMKLYFSGRDSKVRPFIGGGGAYSTGNVNYDQQQQASYGYLYQSYANTSDYTLNQFQAMAQAGIDLKVASNISIGFTYKFYAPLSTNETEQGLQYGYFYGQPLVDAQKQAIRGSIRDSNTSTFQVSAAVTF
jgi:opacity protein-like surface antigen